MQLGLFDLFALFLRCDLVIICLRRFLLKLGFFDSLVIFLFSWKHVYLKCKQNYFQRLHGFSNLNWSLSSCLKLWYISCFCSNFSNFVFRKVHIISWWSLKPVSKEFVFINENFEFIIIYNFYARTSITFETCILFHHILKSMLLKKILHYFIFRVFVKITKNDNFFMPSWVEFY